MGEHQLIEWNSHERLVLTAVGYPANAGGLVATLRLLADSLSAALHRHALPRIADWHRLCCGMLAKATDAARTDPLLHAPSAASASFATYRHFETATAIRADDAAGQRINAATGLVILHAVGQGGRVPDIIAQQLTWLRKRPRKRSSLTDWTLLAQHCPLSTD